jgi:pyridoxamine 5'-phosphate oxidase
MTHYGQEQSRARHAVHGLIDACEPTKVREQMVRDPLATYHRWFAQAERAGVIAPEAMALATADAHGRPSVRFVLLKQADAHGFVFFTNVRSRKGRDLQDNRRASLAVYWDRLRKQVRIEGRVELVSPAEADAYWATRPRESQLGALASRQSAALTSRGALLAKWRALRRQYRGQDVPRPPEWAGYRIIPDAIEFWTHRDCRLHDRELFVRTRNGWTKSLLQP